MWSKLRGNGKGKDQGVPTQVMATSTNSIATEMSLHPPDLK